MLPVADGQSRQPVRIYLAVSSKSDQGANLTSRVVDWLSYGKCSAANRGGRQHGSRALILLTATSFPLIVYK
jgi:hypothetical protein